MNFTKEQQQNYFTLIGKISAIDINHADSQNGVPYIRGTVTVKADESEFNVHFFEMKMWKIGKPDERENPRYNQIQALENGQNVNFSCGLEENKFAGSDGSIISNEQLTLNFINAPKQGQQPGLTFDMVGVVLSPLQEVKNDKGDTTGFKIKIGQGQYRADRGFSVVTLNVDPNMNAAVNYVRDNYKLNDTVRVAGRGKAIIETEERVTESLFGETQVEVFHNHKAQYVIESGLVVSEAMQYSDEAIEYLTTATKDFEATLKSRAAAKPAKAANTFTSDGGQSSGGLSGMLGL